VKVFPDLLRVISPMAERVPSSGILIDGILYPLGGQPPVAHGGTWGDLGWLYAWNQL